MSPWSRGANFFCILLLSPRPLKKYPKAQAPEHWKSLNPPSVGLRTQFNRISHSFAISRRWHHPELQYFEMPLLICLTWTDVGNGGMTPFSDDLCFSGGCFIFLACRPTGVAYSLSISFWYLCWQKTSIFFCVATRMHRYSRIYIYIYLQELPNGLSSKARLGLQAWIPLNYCAK